MSVFLVWSLRTHIVKDKADEVNEDTKGKWVSQQILDCGESQVHKRSG